MTEFRGRQARVVLASVTLRRAVHEADVGERSGHPTLAEHRQHGSREMVEVEAANDQLGSIDGGR